MLIYGGGKRAATQNYHMEGSMNYQVANEIIKLVVSDHGAEMQSITKDGHEYLWSGDAKYWKEHAPVLFPYVGRFTDGKYTLNGTEYEMGIHGFAKRNEFTVIRQEDNKLVFELRDNEETRKEYPCAFVLTVTYELKGNMIAIEYKVNNPSDERMFFGIGAHPGFSVPLEVELSFEDYYLEFSRNSRPYRIGMSETCFLNGKDSEYELAGGNRINLKHDLFDNDAIVLKDIADEVTIGSDKGSRKVTVSYPDFPYIGFWHAPKKDAPYVCVEPWVSLPSRQGIVEEFMDKCDMVRLDAHKEYSNKWSIKID